MRNRCPVEELSPPRAHEFRCVPPPPPTLCAPLAGTLLLLGEAEVQSYAASIAAQFTDVDGRLDQQAACLGCTSAAPRLFHTAGLSKQAGRLWAECTRRRYDFERPWRSAEKVKRLTREQLIAFFDRHVASGSPTRRQLSTHVYAQSMAPPQLRVQLPADDFYPAPRDLLLDV